MKFKMIAMVAVAIFAVSTMGSSASAQSGLRGAVGGLGGGGFGGSSIGGFGGSSFGGLGGGSIGGFGGGGFGGFGGGSQADQARLLQLGLSDQFIANGIGAQNQALGGLAFAQQGALNAAVNNNFFNTITSFSRPPSLGFF